MPQRIFNKISHIISQIFTIKNYHVKFLMVGLTCLSLNGCFFSSDDTYDQEGFKSKPASHLRTFQEDEVKPLIDKYLIFAKREPTENLKEDFYNCLSDMAWRSHTLDSLDQAFVDCDKYTGEDRSRYVTKRAVTYFKIRPYFRLFDGTNIELVNLIKSHLDDEKSFKHINTDFSPMTEKGRKFIRITMNFSAKNEYNATIKYRVWADMNPDNGAITIEDLQPLHSSF